VRPPPRPTLLPYTARFRSERVDGGAVEHPLNPDGLLRLARLTVGQALHRLHQEVVKLGRQLLDVDAQRFEDLATPGIARQRVEQVLQRQVLMAQLAGEVDRLAETPQQLFGNDRGGHRQHSSSSGSMLSRNGNSLARASRSVSWSLVAAPSCVYTSATPMPRVWTWSMIATASLSLRWKISRSTATTKSRVV